MPKVLLLVLLLTLSPALPAQPVTSFTIETVAGMHGIGDLGPLQDALLFDPQGLALDKSGNLFIADRSHNRVRRISRAGEITTVAGTGAIGGSGDGGRGVDAELNRPSDVAVDNFGNVYIADTSSSQIRKLDLTGIITRIAGTGSFGSEGDGGPAVDAKLGRPEGVALDGAGNLYIADTGNHRIRMIDLDGLITTVAGTSAGISGDGGPATSAQLRSPAGVVIGRPHYQRLLGYVIPDFVHVLVDGRIVQSGGKELALELEEKGYAGFEKKAHQAQVASP